MVKYAIKAVVWKFHEKFWILTPHPATHPHLGLFSKSYLLFSQLLQAKQTILQNFAKLERKSGVWEGLAAKGLIRGSELEKEPPILT